MRISIRVTSFTCASLLWAFLAGCAAVNPAADYRRAAQHVAEVTGHADTYRPQDDAAISARVDALLAGGLTAPGAVQVSLLNNPSFQAAWMDVGIARADLVQSGLLSNPSLGGDLRFPAGGGLADLEIALAQNIAALWQIPIRQRTAGAALEQAILVLARKAADLAAETQAAYFRSLAAQELHHVAGENLAIANRLLELTLGRQQAGAGSELDVNLSRGAVLEAELAVESARLSAAEERRSLAKLLGLSTDPETLILSGKLPESLPIDPGADRLIELARQRRPDLKAAQQAVVQAESRILEERLRVFPTVELGVSMERAERQKEPGRNLLADTARASIANGGLSAPEIEPRSQRRHTTDFVIGPSWNLELPIFDQNQAQIAKAEYGYLQAVKSLEGVDRLLTQEVRSVVDRMVTAWRIVGFYRDRFIPLAQSSLDLSQESYKAGRASFLSVLEAQRLFLDTRRRSIEALQAAASMIPEIERVVGAPISELREADGGRPETRPATRPLSTEDR